MLTLHDFCVRQRDFLLEISRALTAQLDLGEVLRLVLNASVVMMTGEVGLIALRDPNGSYRVRATLGLESDRAATLNEQLQDLMTTASTGGLNSDALNVKLRRMAQAIDERLQQSIALPLLIAGEPLGLLVIFRAFRGKANPDDVQVLQSFADQAAIAVHNAQLYAGIDQERRRLAAILENNADGVLILDGDLQVVSFNRALEQLTGWRSVDALGRPLATIMPWEHRTGDAIEDALAGGWPHDDGEPRVLYAEGELRRLDGLTISVGVRYAPLFARGDRLANVIANVRDISNFRRAQEMQNTFISVVSHELRTPIALIKGYAGTLRRDDVAWEPDVVRNSLIVIEEESDRLAELVENLLTASKLQARRPFDLSWDDVRLDELAARSVERFRTQTGKHTLQLHFPSGFPAVPGDAMRLRQVLDNLVGNAIKYSPDGGTITVSGEVLDDVVQVAVRDEGLGIAPQDQAHLFERFYRVDNALSRKTEGTGLGLYLSKAIVEAHGGRISVSSRPKHGATFTIELPRDAAPPPQQHSELA